MPDLGGAVAIVTGAARGNGRAIALGLARAGSVVGVCDLDEAGAADTARAIEDRGGRALHGRVDVRDAESCNVFARAVEAELGLAAILVNNAGILRRSRLDDADFRADWADVMATNLDGTRNMVMACLPHLRETRGRIVNIASIRSVTAAEGLTAYSVSKGAIAQLTKSLAIELAPDGIRVNALAPGAIATDMTLVTRENPVARQKFLTHTPMARIGEPEELVGPVLFLASEMSSYVTGVLLPVDGGYLAV